MGFTRTIGTALLVVVASTWVGSSASAAAQVVAPADTSPRVAAEPGAVTTTASSPTTCEVTEAVRAVPAQDPNASLFGPGPWYINADRSIWAGWGAGAWKAEPEGNKVAWIRPQGTDLRIAGRRLDGPSGPLRASIPCCYPTGFQITGLYFPTAGCWEVTAASGSATLRFVTFVTAVR